MFEHILVPLDHSALAECVLPHAVALAKVFGSRLTLLHVLERQHAGGAGQEPPDLWTWTIRKRETEQYLARIVAQLESAGIRAVAVLEQGQAAQNIVAVAQREDVDLLVLSSHGAGGPSAWSISSVTYKVLLRSHRSVLLVRACLSPGEAQEEIRYRRLLVPLDGSVRSTHALPVVATLAQTLEAQVILAHVVQTPPIVAHIHPTAEVSQLANQLTELNRQHAAAFLERMRSEYAADAIVHLLVNDDPPASLHRVANDEATDLIVLCAHGRTGQGEWPYGHVCTNLILYGTTPLFIVQDRPPEQFKPTQVELESRQYAGH